MDDSKVFMFPDNNSKGNSSIELLYSLEILDTKEKLTGILGYTARTGN